VRPGSLSPMLAAAASINNKSKPFDPLSHTNFNVETSRDDRLPGRTSTRAARNSVPPCQVPLEQIREGLHFHI
jgi:hypothetical protein